MMVSPLLPPMPGNAWLRWDAIERLLPESETVLEIGCGAGALSARLARRYRYTGIDLSRKSVQLARSRVEKYGGRVLHGDTSVVEGRYDLVCAFEVLEHIEDDVEVLRRWREFLKGDADSHVLLTVPRDPSLWGDDDELAGHYRRYTRSSLESTLARAGLRPVRMWTIGGPASYPLKWALDIRGTLRLRQAAGTKSVLTVESGTLGQPGIIGGLFWWAAMIPWRWVQRPFSESDFGTGLAALAR